MHTKHVKSLSFAIIACALVAILNISFTLAAWTTEKTTYNKVTANTVQGEIKEIYEQGQTIVPNVDIEKNVWVKNTGSADAFVRASIKYQFDDGTPLDEEDISFTLNTADWYDGGDGYYGIPEDVANKIYDRMISFAAYAFNKAHAACYAYIAFQTAFLKCHYPKEFLAALMTSVKDNTDKIIEYSAECKHQGIEVAAPSINVSDTGFTVDGACIRYGLSAVKSVSSDVIENVLAERKEKPFSSVYDFCSRMKEYGINRKVVENLIKVGAFDGFGSTRRAMLTALTKILQSVNKDKKKNVEGQLSLFAFADDSETDDYIIPEMEEFSSRDVLSMEKEVSGLYLSGYPLDAYEDKCSKYRSCYIGDVKNKADDVYSSMVLTGIIIKEKVVYTKANQSKMAFVTLEDRTGTIETIVFAKSYEKFHALIHEDAIVVIEGRISKKDDGDDVKFVAETISDIMVYTPTAPKDQIKDRNYYEKRRIEAIKNDVSAGNRDGLWLKVPSADGNEMKKVEYMISNIYTGYMPVFIRFADTRALVKYGKLAKAHPLLITELKKLLGEENVKVVGDGYIDQIQYLVV